MNSYGVKKRYLAWQSLGLAAALVLIACNDKGGTTILTAPDTTPPVVLYAAPAGGATEVATNSAVTVTFSEVMKVGSLTPATFYIEGVSGTMAVSADKRSATFTPASPLAANTTYTANITTGAKDSAGNHLASSASWSFTTGAAPDTTPPQVSSVTPASGSINNQASTTTISVTFNEAIDCISVSTLNVHLLEGDTQVPVEVGCNGSTITLLPIRGIPTNTDLTTSVGASVTDLAGNPFGNLYTWSFGIAPWTRQFGTSDVDFASAITSDGAGNVFVAGDTYGALDGQTSAGLGTSDLFVTKYDANGTKQWTRELGTAMIDFATALTSDRAGNLYVAGYTTGALDGQANAGGIDLFVTKYDADGNKKWTRQLGTGNSDFAYAITLDGSGNVYVAGATYGALDGQTWSGGEDIFVTKYDADGNKKWTRQFGTTGVDEAYALTSDSSGNVYVAGEANGELDGQSWVGATDLFVTKYDANGTKLWTRELGTTSYDVASAITSDSAGNIYVAGITGGALDGQTNAGVPWNDLFVTKYDTNGNKQWTRELGTTSDDYATALTSDGAGNVYMAGYTYGALDGQTYAGQGDLFVTKYDANGDKLWTHQIGTAGIDQAAALTSDGAGNILVAGSTNGALDGQNNAGIFDAFVVKYQSDGRKR